MLHYTILFLLVALVAAWLGFGLVAGTAAFDSDPWKCTKLRQDRAEDLVRLAENIGIGHML